MEARNFIFQSVKTHLIGPASIDEVLYSYPTDTYLTGILYPQHQIITPEEDDKQNAESSGMQHESDTSEDEVSLSNINRPATAGISFVVGKETGEPEISLTINAGIYESERKKQLNTNQAGTQYDGDNGESDGYHGFEWHRSQIEKKISNIQLNFRAKDINPDTHGIEGLRVHIRCAEWENKRLVTVALLNIQSLDSPQDRIEVEEKCFFQIDLSIKASEEKTGFYPRPLRTSASDEDAATAALIYRNAKEYAVGHTCSADWELKNDDMVYRVFTSWLPHFAVPSMSSEGADIFNKLTEDKNIQPLSAKWLSEKSGKELSEGLRLIPTLYKKWLDSESSRIEGLDNELKAQAKLHLSRADTIVARIERSIKLLESDPQVETAFRLANVAIRVQRSWSYPHETDMVWRPFQLGFILLCLSSTAHRLDEDRNTADLLWFPTGGGKTEAYLGLIAFNLFIRRMREPEKGRGVAAIMRYTLRTLTIQQFQRATTLICVCEKIRLGQYLPPDLHPPDLGADSFSIGLWVGSDSVPNSVDEAADAIHDAGSTPVQLSYCPCKQQSDLHWRREARPKSIQVSCKDKKCYWSIGKGSLPVWTVDEDIYRERPSLLIGTVDKFAQIVRKPETVALFGTDGSNQPPDLIIQDELHLISGPLGTLTGLYETAIDELCRSENGARPKVIASTATIREANVQIKALYDRTTCLFPPPVIDASNSGFAVEVDDRDKSPGRLYLGVTTAGRSAKYTLQAVSASLLQASFAKEIKDDERDPYWTMVTYFNSLRELGGALVLMQDDVNRSLEDYASRRKEAPRDINEITELTSRVSSSEIKDILELLKIPFNENGACDILLASNMISVGVDIPRLGLMIVNGQPKSIAEYIQATSRVGRGDVAGLVVTIYNNAKARDRSHYETFRTWHSSLYRDVEATSVTPYSSRARDRALHAVLVALVRHLLPNLRTSPNMPDHLLKDVRKLATRITARAEHIDSEESKALNAELEEIIERWNKRSSLRTYWNDRQINTSLLISAEKAAELKAAGRAPGAAWSTPNSMRNVEPSTAFIMAERLREKPKDSNAK